MNLSDQPSAGVSSEKTDKAQAILGGALEVFTTQGYASASVARIATAAGVSKPTLYSYFQDKEGLFVSLIHYLTQHNSQLLENLTTLSTSLPPDQSMRQTIKLVLKDSVQSKNFVTLMRLIICESEQFPELAQAFVREVSNPMLERLSTYLEHHPQLNLPDPMVAARIIAGTVVHYLIIQELMHGAEIFPMDEEGMVDGLVDVVMMAGGAKHLSKKNCIIEGGIGSVGTLCPHCNSEHVRKNGKRRGKQNHICVDCGRQFVEDPQIKRGYSNEVRQLCLKMYANGMGFREIERVTDIHHTTVIAWVKQTGQLLPDACAPEVLPEDGELDELQTFVG